MAGVQNCIIIDQPRLFKTLIITPCRTSDMRAWKVGAEKWNEKNKAQINFEKGRKWRVVHNEIPNKKLHDRSRRGVKRDAFIKL